MGNNITIEGKIASLNDALKQVFLDMKNYMENKLNDLVNQCRDKILKYAMAIKGTEEFQKIDNLMFEMFIEYSKMTYKGI